MHMWREIEKVDYMKICLWASKAVIENQKQVNKNSH